MGANPTVDTSSPSPAEAMPRKIDPRDSAATSAMAQNPSETFSQGPVLGASRAMKGLARMAIRISASVESSR